MPTISSDGFLPAISSGFRLGILSSIEGKQVERTWSAVMTPFRCQLKILISMGDLQDPKMEVLYHI